MSDKERPDISPPQDVSPEDGEPVAKTFTPLEFAADCLQGAIEAMREIPKDRKEDSIEDARTFALLAIAGAVVSQAGDRAALLAQGSVLGNMGMGLQQIATRVEALEAKVGGKIIMPGGH